MKNPLCSENNSRIQHGSVSFCLIGAECNSTITSVVKQYISSGDILVAGLKCRDLTLNESRQCRTWMCQVLIFRLNDMLTTN